MLHAWTLGDRRMLGRWLRIWSDQGVCLTWQNSWFHVGLGVQSLVWFIKKNKNRVWYLRLGEWSAWQTLACGDVRTKRIRRWGWQVLPYDECRSWKLFQTVATTIIFMRVDALFVSPLNTRNRTCLVTTHPGSPLSLSVDCRTVGLRRGRISIFLRLDLFAR